MVEPIDTGNLDRIEEAIGYTFGNREYLVTAFMHASAADNRLDSNERLEFLGDSVLGLVICEALFEQFPEYLEGDLTKIKSSIVSRQCCTKVARELGLKDYLRVGKGMELNHSLPPSIEAGLLESIIGSIYLDGGLAAARDFIHRAFGSRVQNAKAHAPNGNYKSLLQQVAQEKYGVVPIYNILDEKGPDHNKCFESEVILDDRHFSSAWGVTKKEAEQKAAKKALIELGALAEMTPESEVTA